MRITITPESLREIADELEQQGGSRTVFSDDGKDIELVALYESPPFKQCELRWPSSVSGGMTDDRCPNEATVTVEGVNVCEDCAALLLH